MSRSASMTAADMNQVSGDALIKVIDQTVLDFTEHMLKHEKVWDSWQKGNPVTQIINSSQIEEANRLKELVNKNADKKTLPKSVLTEVNNYQLSLSASSQLLTALAGYNNVEPKFNELNISDDLKKNLNDTYKITLSEHLALARLLMRDKNTPDNTKDMLLTAARVNNLTAYVSDPKTPATLSAVVKDVENLNTLKKTNHVKTVAGGLLKIIGYGMIALSVVMGIGSATGMFMLAPAGIAGLAVSFGFSIAGGILSSLGDRWLVTSDSRNAMMKTHHQMSMFTKAQNINSITTPFLPKPDPTLGNPAPLGASDVPIAPPISTITPIIPAPLPTTRKPIVIPSRGGSGTQAGTAPKPVDSHLLEATKIKKMETVVTSAGWKINDEISVNNKKVREVSNTTGGKEQKFTIGEKDLKTSDADIKTFKLMLECVAATSSELPSIKTDTPELKAKWLQAFKEVYPKKTEKEIAAKITLDSAEPAPTPIPVAPRRP